MNRIQTENLSVRQVEQILQKTKKISKKEKDYFVKEEEQTLKKILGLEVHIKLQKKDSGKITISFHNQDEYQQFINSLK